jgi:methionyl-tRNA formyltransferase
MNILVLSDNPAILERAKPIFLKRKVNRWTFTNSDDINPKKDYKHIIKEYDLVFSLHCKKIFPKELIDNMTCINVLPGIQRGLYTHVYDVFYDCYSGCCIHLMDNEIDHGHVICHVIIEPEIWDTSKTFYDKIIEAEVRLIDDHLDLILKGAYNWSDYEFGHIYRSLADFKKLCEIDLDKKGTFREFYNLLRALSHGDYLNAHIKGTNTYLKLTIHENPNH